MLILIMNCFLNKTIEISIYLQEIFIIQKHLKTNDLSLT